MTRQVAIGAFVGFFVTLALTAWWPRSPVPPQPPPSQSNFQLAPWRPEPHLMQAPAPVKKLAAPTIPLDEMKRAKGSAAP